MNEMNAFFSVWTQAAPYWIVIDSPAAKRLEGFVPAHGQETLFARNVGTDWSTAWTGVCEELFKIASNAASAAVIAGEQLPTREEIQRAMKPANEINAIAENLWLIEDVNAGRLGCYMQKVLDRRGKLVGYEAFARMESADGGVIGGGAIMQAARALHSEYQVDRLLHKHAIESFVARDLDGYIFINFLTGFIQRPEIYLDGLSAAANRSHIRAGSVVLDVPLTDYARDLPKLKSIAEYCRARGFALALDDVMTDTGLGALLTDIRPAFIKLDGKFGQGMNAAKRLATLREIVRLAHGIGANVLAEGVENQEMYDGYFAADVDMFQGYLIGAPERHDVPDAARAKA